MNVIMAEFYEKDQLIRLISYTVQKDVDETTVEQHLENLNIDQLLYVLRCAFQKPINQFCNKNKNNYNYDDFMKFYKSESYDEIFIMSIKKIMLNILYTQNIPNFFDIHALVDIIIEKYVSDEKIKNILIINNNNNDTTTKLLKYLSTNESCLESIYVVVICHSIYTNSNMNMNTYNRYNKKRWITFFRTQTNIGNNISFSMALLLGYLDILIPKSVDFTIISTNNFMTEIKSVFNINNNRQCYFIKNVAEYKHIITKTNYISKMSDDINNIDGMRNVFEQVVGEFEDTTKELKTIFLIDGDNCPNILNQITSYCQSSKWKMHIIYGYNLKNGAKDKMYKKFSHLPWVSFLRSHTTNPNAVDYVLTMLTAYLDCILPKAVKFVLVTDDNFAKEIVASFVNPNERIVEWLQQSNININMYRLIFT